MSDLWCMRVLGPDEMHAAENKEAAQVMADIHNDAMRGFVRRKPHLAEDENLMRAVVEPWSGTAAGHAKNMFDRADRAFSS